MKQDIQHILKERFWLEDFRPGQKEIIESVISGQDSLVFMPTGWGKSLTYQLPGLALEGVCLVISPLISLMKDQVDALQALWIRAELINSTQDRGEQMRILEELQTPYLNSFPPREKEVAISSLPRGENWEGTIKFLYIAPERLNSREFIEVLKNTKISLIAIDEAHCISQWGHDFRPSYMKIKGIIDELSKPPILNSFPPGEKEATSFWEDKRKYIIDLARDFRKNPTKYEDFMWDILRRKNLWYKFRRQHPFWRYIADFYSDELKLVVELDWKIHEATKEYDILRDEIISKYWVKILRIKNEEINDDIEKVVEKILSPLGGKSPKGDRGNIKRPFPIIWLTATATHKVREDIVERLGLEKYESFITGFDRKNIVIVVREISGTAEKQAKTKEILEKTPGVGIIYCSSRKHVIELSEYLISQGIKTGIYKWDLSAEKREEEQNKFMNDEYKVIVATNAFGMGIDKKDIRFVIHYNLPGSIENYYQEVWRAWRDGKKSFWVVLASYGDTKIQEFFIENTYPSKSEILSFYDYLYKDFHLWEWKWASIAKTYFVMASESGSWNDMKVGSIIKILEKYWVIARGMNSSQMQEDFRGRGITLVQEKRNHGWILVDWKRQNLLEEEAYYKLDQIKQLLFYPHCRKRYILEYFGDTEDLETLWENCKTCDYCLESGKYSDEDTQKFLPVSAYSLILETVKKYDEKFGQALIARLLLGSAF